MKTRKQVSWAEPCLLKKTSVIMKVTLFGNMVLTDFIKLEQALVQYSLCPYKNRKRGH